MRAAAKDALKGFLVVLPFVASILGVTYFETRGLQRLLVEAERRNADQHSRSLADRAVIHAIQSDIVDRLTALERRAARSRGE